MQNEDSATLRDALGWGYVPLQQTLLQLGHPAITDRTSKPRTGRMLFCLSPSWVSRSTSQADPDRFSLFVHKAVTFEAGGYAYLDVFDPPCRVTYLLEDSADEKDSLLVGLDCPSTGSPYLNKQTEDVLLTRRLLGERVGDAPPMLALCHGCPPSWQTSTTPGLTVVPMEQAELENVRNDVDAFLQLSELRSCTEVLCWVDTADAHPRAPHTGLQSLRETLTNWGFTQSEVSSIEQHIKQRAGAVMQVIMDHQSGISGAERGGAKVQTDMIGVEFSLSVLDGILQPLFSGVRAHSRGVLATPEALLDSSELDAALGPWLQAMCQRSHSFLVSGKTLLVLGAGGLKGMGIWHVAKTHDIKVVCVSHRPFEPVARLVEHFLVCDYRDHERDEAHAHAIEEALRERSLAPDGCVTFTCSNAILAALLNARLGLPGDSAEAVTVAKTKSRTQLHLAAVRPPSALLPGPSRYASRCQHVAGPSSLAGAAAHVGFPAVMKLEHGAGSEAVVLVEDVRGGREYLSRRPSSGPAFTHEPLLMEYLDGPRYVADVVMHRGKLLAAFLSDCGPSALPYFSNSTHVMPSSLSPESRARTTMAAYQCVLHCGLHSGVYNLDMTLTRSGPKLIEINPRTGGNYLPSWIKAVYGFDMYLAAFLIGCGVRPALWTPAPRGFYVGASCPAPQHVRAMDTHPAFDGTVRSLVETGLVDVMQLRQHFDSTTTVATLNLASFRPSKEEAARRVLASFRVLGLDAGGYPVEQFLDPLL
ncbi:carnosine synthase 1-like [Aplochiton taeniatus]